MENTTKETTYTEARREAYLRNKDKISEREKIDKRWVEYYEKNKEKIAERRKAKRKELKEKGEYKRKSRAVPIDESKIKRYDEIIAELADLKKEVSRKRRQETLAKKKIEDNPGDGLKPGVL
jgi:hypothetical protein